MLEKNGRTEVIDGREKEGVMDGRKRKERNSKEKYRDTFFFILSNMFSFPSSYYYFIIIIIELILDL